jgi:hypothetical protein
MIMTVRWKKLSKFDNGRNQMGRVLHALSSTTAYKNGLGCRSRFFWTPDGIRSQSATTRVLWTTIGGEGAKEEGSVYL